MLALDLLRSMQNFVSHLALDRIWNIQSVDRPMPGAGNVIMARGNNDTTAASLIRTQNMQNFVQNSHVAPRMSHSTAAPGNTAGQHRQYSVHATQACVVCPAGNVTNTLMNTGAINCTACAAGQYSNVSTQACALCAAGQYQPVSSMTTCLACRAGSITDTLSAGAAVSCIACAAGQYSNTSTRACAVCVAGSTTDTLTGAGAVMCTACVAGPYSTISTEACAICPAGNVTNTLMNTGAINCTASWRYSTLQWTKLSSSGSQPRRKMAPVHRTSITRPLQFGQCHCNCTNPSLLAAAGAVLSSRRHLQTRQRLC
eukprot:COSAG01_NODE_9961_length_2291_cov_1.397354_1_plen_314_part_00